VPEHDLGGSSVSGYVQGPGEYKTKHRRGGLGKGFLKKSKLMGCTRTNTRNVTSEH